MTASYAVYYGYAYILDMDGAHEVPCGENLHLGVLFHKILAVQRHLKDYPAIVWIDTDATVMSEPRPDIFHYLLFSDPNSSLADLIMADHYDNINNGVMLLRNSKWTHEFLDLWWRKSWAYGCRLEWWGDQNSLYLSMIEALEESHPVTPWMAPEHCPDPATCHEHNWHHCLNDQMSCRGFGYNNRTCMGHFSILPQSEALYRINQWYIPGPLSKRWKEENFYKRGDVVVHSKHHREVLDVVSFSNRLAEALAVVSSSVPSALA